MDANGLKFWMLADGGHWRIGEGADYDPAARRLRLSSRRQLPLLPGSDAPGAETAALARLEFIPQALDGYHTRAYWDGTARAVMATGAVEGSVPIFIPPGSLTPTDLAMGYDGVLYVALPGGIVLLDRRYRWEPVFLAVEGFQPWRLAAEPSGGVWALDRANRSIGRVEGLPFPDRPYGPYSPNTVRPCEENPDSPRLTVLDDARWPDAETTAGIACSPQGRLALLTWDESGHGMVRCLESNEQFGLPVQLNGARRPYSIKWVDAGRVAVLLPALAQEALVYPLDAGAGSAEPVGDFHPLRDHDLRPFLNGVTLPPHYPTVEGSAPLYPLSLPSHAARGEAFNNPVLDSGDPQTIWHRIYLEAVIPDRCGVRVYLAAGDDPTAEVPPEDWHEHLFGEVFRQDAPPGVPRGAWVSAPSEIPYHPGLLDCPPQKGSVGLFTALAQRANRPVRTLSGRFLLVRVVLHGDGLSTPEVAALRVYASRFSYRDQYLPSLYRETLFGEDADAVVAPGQRSTPTDFLGRFLDNMEGVLTPLEDRIAGAYLLTNPQTAPEDSLEWLGNWVGLALDPACPPERQRRLLAQAHLLHRQRGTLPGLARALDLCTGGMVGRGELVLLEDFRLRRAFATILGADLADEDDPLLAGVVASGNSYVGDTLFLGDENRREFLALFGADLPTTDAEAEEIEAFLDALAFRATVLVHRDVAPEELALIRRVVEMETPAHVLMRVQRASHPFIVGLAALVGVDTFLDKKPEPGPVRVEQSRVGLRDLVQRPASLDPRLEGGAGPTASLALARPTADAGSDMTVAFGRPFELDAGRSRAEPGRRIDRYIWTWTQ